MFDSAKLIEAPLSRRKILAAAGLAVAAPAMARGREPAPAAATGRDLQGAGFYRRKVGTFDVALISDGTFPLAPPFPLFGANAGEEKVKAALDREFIAYDHTLAHVNTLVIKTGKDVVLIDTGCGTVFGPTTGKTLANLAAAGVAAKDVTAVVITHAHRDHIGGLLSPSGGDVFPNAQYFVHKDELSFWNDGNPDLSKSGLPAETQSAFVESARTALKNVSKRLTVLGDSLKVVDGVDALPAPGHTPGHLTLLISSGNEQLYYITDAIHHHAIMMPNPDFYVAFDTDREAGAKQRRAILDRATADRLLVSGSHMPFPGFGHVRKNGEGFQWVPSVWEW